MNKNISFPVGVFPAEVENYIEELSEGRGLCYEFLAGAYLAAASTLIGRTSTVKIDESWEEYPILWIALVGMSGYKKTPAIKAMLRPLRQLDKKMFLEYKTEYEEFEKAKANDENARQPVPKQITVDDATIEALVAAFINNPDGLLLHKDELISLVFQGNNYSNNSDYEQRLLSIYSDDPFWVNRKTSPTVHVETAFLSMIGGVQPGVLGKLFTKERMDNGFINRLLFAYSPLYRPTLPQIDYEGSHYLHYENFMQRFYELRKEWSSNRSRQIVPLSIEARQRYFEWRKVFVFDQTESPFFGYLSKLEAAAARISLVIQCGFSLSQQEAPAEVSLDAMNAGIKIVEHYYETFLAMYSDYIDQEPGIRMAKRIASARRKIFKLLISGHSIKEAVRSSVHESGFAQHEIQKATDIPKSTISKYANAT